MEKQQEFLEREQAKSALFGFFLGLVAIVGIAAVMAIVIVRP